MLVCTAPCPYSAEYAPVCILNSETALAGGSADCAEKNSSLLLMLSTRKLLDSEREPLILVDSQSLLKPCMVQAHDTPPPVVVAPAGRRSRFAKSRPLIGSSSRMVCGITLPRAALSVSA